MLLGYLAFRGIQNDQALLEQQRLSEHRTIAQQIAESVNGAISKVEKAFYEPIANTPSPPQPSAVLPSLELLKSEQCLVEEVFLFERPGRIRLPLEKLVFLPGGNVSALHTQLRRSTLLPGERYEFQQERYQEALTSYEQVFAQVSNRQVKGEVLNAIVRVQKKSKLFPDAIESYETIAQDYSDVRTGNGMPLGLAARLELGDLFLAIDDSSSAAHAFLRVYEDLIQGDWTLDKSQYEFFVQQVEESFDEIFLQDEATQSYRSTFRMLRDEETRQREITERLLAFQENAAPGLLVKVPRNTEGPADSTMRYILDIGGRTYFVSMPGEVKEEGDRANAIWGFLLDPEQLKSGLLTPAIQRHVSSGDIHWTIKGREGETILASNNALAGPMTVRTTFAGNFPLWSLEFYQPAPRLFETLLTSRRLYVFILLAGILVFGLTLIIRIVTHEFELGRRNPISFRPFPTNSRVPKVI